MNFDLTQDQRSVALNLREAQGRELLAELVTRPGPGSGLYLTNLPAREPLTYDALR